MLRLIRDNMQPQNEQESKTPACYEHAMRISEDGQMALMGNADNPQKNKKRRCNNEEDRTCRRNRAGIYGDVL